MYEILYESELKGNFVRKSLIWINNSFTTLSKSGIVTYKNMTNIYLVFCRKYATIG
jgi:hypothetical protein